MLAQLAMWLNAMWLNVTGNEDAQGMVEYGLILALIAVVVIATLTSLGTAVKNEFCHVLTGLGGGTC